MKRCLHFFKLLGDRAAGHGIFLLLCLGFAAVFSLSPCPVRASSQLPVPDQVRRQARIVSLPHVAEVSGSPSIKVKGSEETGVGSPVVNVRESSTIVPDVIRLGEMAEILGPDSLVREMSGIRIGYAPKPGEVRVLTDNWLKSRITSVSWLPGDLQLRIPKKIYVRRAFQEVSRERLKVIFENYVQDNLPLFLGATDDYRINDFSVRGVGIYPAGKLTLFPEADSARVPMGRVSLRVRVGIDGREEGMISLTGQVDVFDQVVYAARSLRRGTVLSADDFMVKRANVSKIRGGYLNDPEDALGMALRTGVSRGRVIGRDMLEDPPLVRSGDVVTLVAERGGLRILATGLARGEGRMGDHIRVENLRSGKTVHGRIKGQGEVTVIY